MNKQTRKFCSLVQVELEDLIEDVQHSIQLAGYKHKQDEISDKIYKENLTVYHSELSAFKDFGHILNEAKNNYYSSIPELSEHLKERFKETIASSGYVERAMFFMDRKFKKILNYMEQTKE